MGKLVAQFVGLNCPRISFLPGYKAYQQYLWVIRIWRNVFNLVNRAAIVTGIAALFFEVFPLPLDYIIYPPLYIVNIFLKIFQKKYRAFALYLVYSVGGSTKPFCSSNVIVPVIGDESTTVNG